MIDRDIKELRKLFKSLKTSEEAIRCVYCGCPATDKEHVIPLSAINQFKRMKECGIEVSIPKEEIVDSCRECNLMASDRYFENISEKKKFIKNKIAKRYRKLLKSSDWTDEEIMSLNGRLREYIFLMQKVKELIQQRLLF